MKPLRHSAVGALAFLVLTTLGGAQPQLQELGLRYLPPDTDSSAAVALGDVDGDGDRDAVIGNFVGQNRLYLNDGTGVFAEAMAGRMPVDSDRTRDVALVDVDGDGDLDLVIANYSQQNKLYLNDGSGAFADVTATRMPVDTDTTTSIAMVDVDGDGTQDMVLGNLRAQNRLYLNTGAGGSFVDATAGRMPAETDYTQAVAAADVDGDGDQDLLIGHTGALGQRQNRLYVNSGTGHFGDASATRMPVDDDSTTSVAVGDVDGDGDLDVVFGNSAAQNALYLNDGAGVFTDATPSGMPADVDFTTAVVMRDVDGDGDPDLVLGNTGDQDRLYLNDGAAVFSDATASRMPVDQAATAALAVGDADGDGDEDVLLARSAGANALYLDDGAGTFTDVTRSALPSANSTSFAAVMGDVDGDGDPDLVFGNTGAPSQSQNQLYLNDGTGSFTDVTAARMPIDSNFTNAVILCDVDGDGDLDMVTGNNTTTQPVDRLYLNDGGGLFTDVTATHMPLGGPSTTDLAVGDVDGDGWPDLVLATSGARSRLYLNDGTGRFANATVSHMPPGADYTLGVALEDVDGDGDRDLMLANGGPPNQSQNRLYLNDGMGFFTNVTAAQMPIDTDTTRVVVLRDVDGDGDADAVLGNYATQNRLYLNDGQGRFSDATATRLPADTDFTTSLVLGDVDGNGAPDLVIGNNGPTLQRQNRLYLNDGKGFFADVTTPRMAVDDDLTWALAFGDVDGDGDSDLVTANSGQNRLYRNLRRHLDAPLLPRVGHTWQLDAYARYGPTRWTDFAIPMIASAPASIPLPPLGTLGLEPTTAVGLPPLLIPRGSGVVSVALTVPDVAALAGIPLFAQAMLIQVPVENRLTNVIAHVVVDL